MNGHTIEENALKIPKNELKKFIVLFSINHNYIVVLKRNVYKYTI
jgi:hypothetical protein